MRMCWTEVYKISQEKQGFAPIFWERIRDLSEQMDHTAA